jgi:hypothetical protein
MHNCEKIEINDVFIDGKDKYPNQSLILGD